MIKIKSLNIVVGDKELELSIKSAEELYYVLGKALNKNPIIQKEYAPYIPYYQDRWWQTPITNTPNIEQYQIYCSDNINLTAHAK